MIECTEATREDFVKIPLGFLIDIRNGVLDVSALDLFINEYQASRSFINPDKQTNIIAQTFVSTTDECDKLGILFQDNIKDKLDLDSVQNFQVDIPSRKRNREDVDDDAEYSTDMPPVAFFSKDQSYIAQKKLWELYNKMVPNNKGWKVGHYLRGAKLGAGPPKFMKHPRGNDFALLAQSRSKNEEMTNNRKHSENQVVNTLPVNNKNEENVNEVDTNQIKCTTQLLDIPPREYFKSYNTYTKQKELWEIYKTMNPNHNGWQLGYLLRGTKGGGGCPKFMNHPRGEEYLINQIVL